MATRVGTVRPLACAALTALCATTALAAQQRPQLAPYHADPSHPANRLFRAIFTVELVPAIVAAALPGEHGDDEAFFVPGWYFEKREGNEADRRWFGGDGRQLPREGFDADEARHLAGALAELRGDRLTGIRDLPRLAVYLQNDLYRLVARLLATGNNPELLPPLRAAAERLALDRTTLLATDLQTFEPAQAAAHLHGHAPEDLVELERRSSRLFDAEFTQLWSRVHLAASPTGTEATLSLLETLATATRETLPEVPLGTTALLSQGIVAVDADGRACATGLVIDVRIQHFANRDPLGADNPTTTRDGIDFAQWLLPRRTVRDAGGDAIGLADFETIAMDKQELFRDYGTSKHTTYRGQCSLCHRRTNTPDAKIAGFSALRPTANPRPVDATDARLRLAETEMQRFVDALANRF